MNTLVKRLKKQINIKIISLLIFFSHPLLALQQTYDYYQPAPDRLLENVEKYHLNLGIEHLKKGALNSAKAEFDFMLRYFPNHPRALQLNSEVALAANMPELIPAYFERALKYFPRQAATYGLYGVLLHRANQPEAAIKQYEQSIAINPKNAEVLYNLGLARMAMSQYELANQHAQAAYQQGYPLQGLKHSLERMGAWQERPADSHD